MKIAETVKITQDCVSPSITVEFTPEEHAGLLQLLGSCSDNPETGFVQHMWMKIRERYQKDTQTPVLFEGSLKCKLRPKEEKKKKKETLGDFINTAYGASLGRAREPVTISPSAPAPPNLAEAILSPPDQTMSAIDALSRDIAATAAQYQSMTTSSRGVASPPPSPMVTFSPEALERAFGSYAPSAMRAENPNPTPAPVFPEMPMLARPRRARRATLIDEAAATVDNAPSTREATF